MTAALIVLVVGLMSAFLVWRRLFVYLRYFQQEGYAPLRFLRWVTLRSLTDPAVWLAGICRLIAGTGMPAAPPTSSGIGAGITAVEQAVGLGVSVTSPPSGRELGAAILFTLVAIALARNNRWGPALAGPRQSNETPLKLAPRAKRIRRVAFATAFVIQAIGQVPAIILLRSTALEPYLFLALLFAALPLLLLFANVLLGPYERGLQHTLEIEARRQPR